ncbi:G-alpha-domain-containing protein [Auriscalpium vulgare]|uniref:G-alpha-domain-containing protein n=1 Tax=Auriscalpium vulgare TaxID=40419 RepID=A0ACB8RIP2_9AGAM|nr:G-alpha-domain-containing protein [Auriscalpium vulgare]
MHAAARRRSLSDPFAVMLQPPPDESPAQREMRILAEQQAKHISDAIDEQIRMDKTEMRKAKPDVKILLLGQSESGKSTTLKQFQLMHTPAAFNSERLAWRSVIYLNLVRSIRRILDAISANPDPDPHDLAFDGASIISDRTSGVSPPPQDPEKVREAAEKYADYTAQLAPLLELEERLIRMLSEDDEDDEATRLGDGSTPGWSVPRASTSTTSSGSVSGRRPSIHVDASTPEKTAAAPRRAEVSVRTTSNWKKALSLRRDKLKSTSPHTGTNELVGWWEDPEDPVHVLDRCKAAMTQLWEDRWVRARLQEKRIRLEESSGFYLDEIERITSKKYFPTDDDVLKARLKTMGVVEHEFALESGLRRSKWKIYDVGGARNQRQAWAPYFEDVNAIIFLAPISAFDQVLTEDSRVNRLEDSLLLWRTVVGNKLLANAAIVLFLNKCDLLQSKLESGVLLKSHLLTYGERPNDYESVSKYLRNKFGLIHQQHTPSKDRELYIHYTAVTDTRRTATIIASVRDSVLRLNLKTSKLM